MKAKIKNSLKKEDYPVFIKNYKASQMTRDVLYSLLQQDLDKLSQDEERLEKIQEINWQLNQAYSLGYRKALRYVMDLLSQKTEE